MRKKSNKQNENSKSIFTDLDKDMKRENQVYVNEEILEKVMDAKKKSVQAQKDDLNVRDYAPIPSTVKQPEPDLVSPAAKEPVDSGEIFETPKEDLDIYDSLFSETTIVSTQIYTYDIDKSLGGDNYSSKVSYRVGQDSSEIGSIFTITRKELNKQINVSHSSTQSDIDWYNNLAGLGFSYAAVCGTTVQGIIICEPQYWNNTLLIRHLMVAKNFRLSGIGSKLIDECMQRAQMEGFRAVTLEVTSKNGAAVDFYKKMHFSITGLNAGLYSNSDLLKEDVGIFMNRIII